MDYQPNQFPAQTYECIVDNRAVNYLIEHFTELDLGKYYDDTKPTGQKKIDCKSQPLLIMNFLKKKLLNGLKKIKEFKKQM